MEIIYEDNDILLCRKPAGVATQTKRLGQQDMESLLRNYRAGRGEEPYIGIVHRLDQPVEGLMVFAKNSRAASELSKQVRERMIGKHYYAVSANQAPQSEGTLEDYLLTDKKSNVTRVVNPSDKNTMKDAKLAKLEYKLVNAKELVSGKEDSVPQVTMQQLSEISTEEVQMLADMQQETDERLTVVPQAAVQQKFLYDITLHTGRQHQIRVQMAHMGCPLLGDVKYGECEKDTSGSTSPTDTQRTIQRAATQQKVQTTQTTQAMAQRTMHTQRPPSTLALCSYRLEFRHPATGKPMDFRIIPQGGAFRGFTEYLADATQERGQHE